MTNDYDMGDIIRGLLGNPLDAVAKATEPAISEQIVDASIDELKDLTALAEKAAKAQDELKSIIGTKQKDLRNLKNELKDRMLKHGLNDLRIAGRPPIEITESSSRKPTRKAIIEAMIKALGDEKEGKMKALNLWNMIEPTTSQSLKIPDASPVEPDSPY